MIVFISHSFEDKAQLDNLYYSLENQKIEFWDLNRIHTGKYLGDQLRDAILKCDVCIFLATNNSVKSSWCAAELGAFWGAGKPVLIYQAEPTLDIDKLPKQFNGHFIETRIKNLINALRGFSAQLKVKQENKPSIDWSSIQELIESALNRVLNINQLNEVFDKLTRIVIELGEMDEVELRALLSRLLMRDQSQIQNSISDNFRFRFQLITSTGEWIGYAQEQGVHGPEHAPDVISYRHCILMQFDERLHTKSVAFVERVIEGYNRGVTGTSYNGKIVLVGRGLLGEAIKDQNYEN